MEFFTTEQLVIVLFVAVTAAILYSFFMQRSLSALAAKILEKKANSEENALSLNKLGYKSGISAAAAGFFAENGNSIARAIVKVKDESESRDSDMLFAKKSEVRYYIPDENNDKRLEKHINDKLSYPKLLLIILLLAVIALSAGKIIDLLTDYASTLTQSKEEIAVGVENDDKSLLEKQEEANRQEELEKQKQEEREKLEQQIEAELEAAQNAEENANDSDTAEQASENTDNNIAENGDTQGE